MLLFLQYNIELGGGVLSGMEFSLELKYRVVGFGELLLCLLEYVMKWMYFMLLFSKVAINFQQLFFFD